MTPSFIVERTTRSGDQRLGPLKIDADTALEMAGLGQGLLIGWCIEQRTVQKIVCAVRNLNPYESVVCCHSYELAHEITETFIEDKVPVALIVSDGVREISKAKPVVIVTVPEALHKIREPKATEGFKPRILFLFDLNGITFRPRTEEWGRGNRATFVSRFRATLLASGCPILPIVCVSGTPAAYMPDTVFHALGIEALLFADGPTMRTAFDDTTPLLKQEAPIEQSAEPQAQNMLDEVVTRARQNRSRLLLHVSPTTSASAALLSELAALRGYPVLSLHPFCHNIKSELPLDTYRARMKIREIANQISRSVTVINKQVVILNDVVEFYGTLSARSALFCLAAAVPAALMIVPGPDGLSPKDIQKIFGEIRRLEPGIVTPRLHEA